MSNLLLYKNIVFAILQLEVSKVSWILPLAPLTLLIVLKSLRVKNPVTRWIGSNFS